MPKVIVVVDKVCRQSTRKSGSVELVSFCFLSSSRDLSRESFHKVLPHAREEEKEARFGTRLTVKMSQLGLPL